jgi:hypothetical protein
LRTTPRRLCGRRGNAASDDSMICERCGAFFCIDYFGGAPQKYCGEECRKAAKWARKRASAAGRVRHNRWRVRTRTAPYQEASCERKRHFASMDEAATAWRALPGIIGGVYKCGGCGDWHITSKNGVVVITPGERCER